MELGKKFEGIAELVGKTDRNSKEAMKKVYDKRAKEREFTVGTLVLLKVPDPGGKLSDPWKGPYEVKERVFLVNYKLSIPHRRSKEMTVHVNRMKLE